MRTQKRGYGQQRYLAGLVCFVIITIAVIACAGEEMEPGVSSVSVGRFGWQREAIEGLLVNHVTPQSICRGLEGQRWEMFFQVMNDGMDASGKKKVINLEGKWKFCIDPEDTGVKEGWEKIGFDDSTWKEINVPGPWEKEGITQVNPKCNPQDKDPYNGYAWYRIQVEVPAEWKGCNDIYLSLGKIDDLDWAYVNGQQIGGITREGRPDVDPPAYQQYRVYKVPQETLHFGQKNTIAVRVYDDHGAGGLICRPVALHVGRTTSGADIKTAELDWVGKTWTCNINGVEYQLRMSLLYPFVELNTTAPVLRLRQRKGRFLFMALPTKRGVLVKDLCASDYEAERDGELSENWMLLFGASTGKQDLPVQLVFSHPPVKIKTIQQDSVEVKFEKSIGRVMIGMPFGLRTWSREETLSWSAVIPDSVAKQARLWGRMLVCPPVRCQESFQLNEDKGCVIIRNEFTYQEGEDAWKTRPLLFAPLPPIVSYARGQSYGVSVKGEVVDMNCPTRFGPLEAVLGCRSVEYTLPLPAYEHGAFLGREEDRYGWNMLVKEQMKSLVYGFRGEGGTGLSGPARCGSIQTMFLLDKPTQEQFIQALREALDFALVQPPAKGRLRPITAWVDRVEPTSGRKFIWIPEFMSPEWSFGYNPAETQETFSKKEGVCDADAVMGHTLVKIANCAAFTAQWDLIRNYWKQIRRLYELIEVTSDWAWAGPSCCEWGGQGMSIDDFWDGYGSHGALARMAKGLGDDTTYRYARYLQAKEAIWSVMIFTFTDYLRQYYPIPPDQVVAGLGEDEPWEGVTESPWAIQRHYSYKYRTGPEAGSYKTGYGGSPYGAWLTYGTSFTPEGYIWPAMKDPQNVKRHLDRSEEGVPDWDRVATHQKNNYSLLFVIQPMYLRILTGYPQSEVLEHFLRLYQDPMDSFLYPLAAAANADVPIRLASWEPMRIIDARYHDKEGRAEVRLDPAGVICPVLRAYCQREPDWVRVNEKKIAKLHFWRETKRKIGWYRDNLGYVTIRLEPSQQEITVSFGWSHPSQPAVVPDISGVMETTGEKLSQGGFEGPLLLAWQGGGGGNTEAYRVTTPVHSGKYALRGKLLGDNKPPWAFASQTIQLRQQTPFRVVAWCYVPEKSDKDLRIVCYHIFTATGSNEKWGDLPPIRAEDTPTKGWIKLTQDFPSIPKGEPTTYLSIIPHCKIKGITAYFDDISLEYLNGDK